MLGLRTTDGAALEDLRQSSPQSSLFISDLLPKVHHFQQSGLISIDKAGAIKIPPEHFFISDGIIRDLFV